ncbi:hypothetical protein MKP07_33490 [Niabella hibiscisoli]|nr:hypothetical protein [Niabella hibiscisoli]MCH5720779.1 hypothetical protein [Niabella hibiscisoli]
MGLDFGLFNNRISGSIELYKQATSSLCYHKVYPLPPAFPMLL